MPSSLCANLLSGSKPCGELSGQQRANSGGVLTDSPSFWTLVTFWEDIEKPS